MKGEVEVTFKCEGCGTTLLVSKHNPANHQVIHTNLIDLMKPGDLQCPNCAKLTYGPLTEEMVAEALFKAVWYPNEPEWERQSPNNMADFRKEARFVLRLLDYLWVHKGLLPALQDENYRDWLLDLAREK